MRGFTKRGLSLLLAFVMVIGLLSGIPMPAKAATVTYKTASNGYIYNWGTRGEVATFLSPNAETFYSTNNVTYAELAALSGSTSTSSVPSSALYTKLADLMADNHSYKTGYDATRSMYKYTDCQNNAEDTTKISSFYSGTLIGPDWDSGSTWNREHTWPNSKGLGGQDENDIMMLRPTSVKENSSRGNTAYGESSSYYHPNEVSGGEYDLRGDVARIVLYVYVRWGNTSYMWGTSGVMESKDVLLTWMKEDPVDTWELGRNDSVESITGTRNVFVDYPELAFLLFGESVPADYSSPSGGASASFTLSAASNDTSLGTVTVSGNTIIATPAQGCYASGYTVTSGSATVTQSGNTFTVSASADCSVQITFAAKTAISVSFSENGVITSTTNGYAGDSITLPTAAAPEGYSFVGWVTGTVNNATEKPSVIADPYTASETQTLYALYSQVVSDGTDSGTSSEGVFEKVTQAPEDWSGTYLIVSEGDNVAFDGSLTKLDAANNSIGITIENNQVIATDETLAATVTIASSTSGLTIKTSSGYYIGTTNTDNSLESSTTTAYSNTITIDNSGNAVITSSSDKILRFNNASNQMRFRYYGSGQQAIQLYKLTGVGTRTYTTQTCEHPAESLISVDAVSPTCTEVGYTAGTQCSVCQVYTEGHTVVSATGHSYESAVTTAPTCTETGVRTYTCQNTGCTDSYTEAIADTGHNYTSVVTAPTATEQGYTTYTCQNADCGHTYVDNYVAALGETYIVSFRVPGGVDAVSDMECNNTGISLPTPTGDPSDTTYSYKFLGWVEADYNRVTDKPSYYPAGTSYVAESNVTLIALYSYVVSSAGDSGTTDYVLTDIANIEPNDKVVITMTNSSGVAYALPNNETSTPSATVVTVSNNTLTAEPADTLLWNVSGEEGAYIFSPDGVTSTWLYCKDSSKGVQIGNSAAGKTFSISGNYLYSSYAERYVGVYNGEDWRCYQSSGLNIAGQTLGFYVQSAGTTYYTTVFCAHTNGTVEVPAVEPTCAKVGYTAGTKCADCGTVITGCEVIPTTDEHSYSSSVTTAAGCTTTGVRTYTCSVCGDSYTEEIAAAGHSYVDGACSACGEAEPGAINYGPLVEGVAYTGYVCHIANNTNLYFVGEIQKPDEGGYLSNSSTYLVDGQKKPVDIYIERVEGEGIRFYFVDASQQKQYIEIYSYYVEDTDEYRPRAQLVTTPTQVFTYNADNSVYTTKLTLGTTEEEVFFGTHPNWTNINAATTDSLGYYYPLQFCTHQDVVTSNTATCTTAGHDRTKCNHCLAYLEDTAVDALGHNFVNGVCTRCGAVQVTVTYSVPNGVTAPAPDSCLQNETVTLPATLTGSPTDGPEGREYTFVGWSSVIIDNVKINDVDTYDASVDTFYKLGEAITVTENLSLYAVYKYGNAITSGDTDSGTDTGTDTGTDSGSTTTSTVTYTFADYDAGTQYAEGEEHILDDKITVVTTDCYFTSELRIYSSSTNDGYAIIKSTDAISSITLNVGNNTDTLNVYGSNDNGATWTLITGISTTSAYTDQTVDLSGNPYSWLKLDVAGTKQVRVAYMTITSLESSSSSGSSDSGSEKITITLFEPGKTTYVENGTALPEAGAYADYTFLGWVADKIDSETASKPTTIYAAGDVFEATESTTLYALYSKTTEGGSESTSTDYILTDIANIGATDEVVITMTYTTDGTVYALSSANGTSKAPAATTVTVSGNKLATTPSNNLIWNVGGSTGEYIFYPNGSTSTWLYCTSSNNGVRVGTNTANTFSIDSSSGYLKHNGTSRYLGVYRTTPDWRCYTNTTGNTANQTLAFYVKTEQSSGSTTSYITPYCSAHTNTETSTVAANCTTAGSTTVTCTDCGYIVSTTAIPATGHSYVNGTCSVCGDTSEDGLYITTIISNITEACDHAETTTVVTPATCTTAGEKKTVCANEDCGTVLGVETIPAAHTDVYVDNGDGTHSHTCSVCNAELSQHNKEHSFNSVTGKCVLCNAADTLRFSSASLVIEQGISINFKAKSYLFEDGGLGYSDPYATFQFTVGDKTYNYTAYPQKNEDGSVYIQNGCYIFTLYNVRPDWMGVSISATLHATDASTAQASSQAIEYSIYTYCNNKFNAIIDKYEDGTLTDADKALAKLVIDILNYGAAAQTYSGFNTDNLVNNDLSWAADWGTPTDDASNAALLTNAKDRNITTDNLTSELAKWNSAALFLRETTRIRLGFTAESTEGMTVQIVLNGTTYNIESTAFISDGKGTHYIFFDELRATEMYDTFTATVMKDGAAVSQTLTYSAATYAKGAITATNPVANLPALMQAMLRYGNAAQEYKSALS